MFKFPGDSGGCNCSSNSRLEIFAALFGACAEFFAAWLNSKEERAQKDNNDMTNELHYFKDEVRYLREELKNEKAMRVKIEEALADRGLAIGYEEVESES